MAQEKEETIGKKSRRKVYGFSLSEDNVNEFNKKIGYGSRSEIVNNLISDFVKKGKISTQAPTRRKSLEFD